MKPFVIRANGCEYRQVFRRDDSAWPELVISDYGFPSRVNGSEEIFFLAPVAITSVSDKIRLELGGAYNRNEACRFIEQEFRFRGYMDPEIRKANGISDFEGKTFLSRITNDISTILSFKVCKCVPLLPPKPNPMQSLCYHSGDDFLFFQNADALNPKIFQRDTWTYNKGAPVHLSDLYSTSSSHRI